MDVEANVQRRRFQYTQYVFAIEEQNKELEVSLCSTRGLAVKVLGVSGECTLKVMLHQSDTELWLTARMTAHV